MKTKIVVGTLAVLLSVNFAFAKTYATFKGGKVTDKDVEAALGTIPNAPTLDRIPKDAVEKLVKQIIEAKLFAAYAKSSGVTKSVEYKQRMAKLEEGLVSQLYIEEEFKKIKISEKEAKAFYEKNKDKFVAPEQVRARHILVENEKEAQKIIKELKKASSSELENKFAQLARENSKDPGTKNNGGDLGYFSKERMEKAFSETAFWLKPGEFTTKPVQTPYGFHVIMSLDKKKSRAVPFEEMADRLTQYAKQEKLKDSINSKVNSLVKKANVKYTF